MERRSPARRTTFSSHADQRPLAAAAVKTGIEKTVATFGGFDVLVNNAGTTIPNKFEEATLEELDRVIDIDARGPFVATRRR